MKITALFLAIMMAFCFISCTTSENTATPAPTTSEVTTEGTTPTSTAPSTAQTEVPGTTPDATPTETTAPVITGIDSAALEYYKAASKKVNEAESISYVCTAIQDITSSGMSMSASMKNTTAITNRGKDNIIVRDISEGSFMGMETKTDSYYENGILYVNEDGEKYKTETDLENSGLDLAIDNGSFLLVGEDDNSCRASQVISNDDGTKTITIILSSEDLSDDFIEESGFEGQISVNITAKLDAQDNIIEYTLIIEAEAEGMSVKLNAVFSSFVYGSDVKVEAPEGYTDYPESEDDFDLDIDF